jgi:hypothetical protein
MKKIVTTNYKLHVARQILESISEVANTAYYFFVGNHVPRTESAVPEIFNKQKDTFVDPYRNMIMGKRVGINDMSLVIRNIPYETNKVFAHYDDDDNEVYIKDYYCVVDEGSYRHVYICLDNNNDSNSIIQPDFSHINGSNTVIYETSDGYRWKYLYSVSSSIIKKFGTVEYIPVVANNVVTNSAVDGSVDFIKVTSGGRGYNNYLSGQFDSNDISPLGQTRIFRITNSAASTISNFYQHSLLYFSTGKGAGQYSNISSYVINSSGRFIETEIEFANPPDATTSYQINPRVNIEGDGTQTINAVARALINSTSSNSVYRIEIIESGAGYDYYTATVVPPANNVLYIAKEAELRTILSPAGGHGYDIAKDLNSSKISVSIKFDGNESNTILTTNEFKQVGIMRDPMFNNVNINFTVSEGQLLSNPSEQIYKITPKRFATDVTTNSLSSNIVSNTALFENQLIQGDYIYIKTDDNQNHMLTTVKNIHSNTIIEINSNAFFSSSNASVYYANISSYGYVSNLSVNSVKVSNVNGIIQTGDELIGINSGGYIKVDSVSRNGNTKGFNTFIQLYKYIVDVQVSGFIPNEVIYQGNTSGPRASLHTIKNVDGLTEIFTSNQIGQFTLGTNIIGQTSGAIANVTALYSPELVFGSGDILYIENTEAFERSNTQSETFKVIFEF